MPEKDSQKTQPEHRRRALRRTGKLLWTLALLPVRTALLALGLLERLVLALATFLIVGYFVATMVVDADFAESILNDQLLGEFEIGYLDFSLFSDDVGLYDVDIRHPDGYSLVTAAHIQTNFNRIRLVSWLVGNVIGFEKPLPLHFRETSLDDYSVVLRFEETGLTLVDAFNPRIVTPTPSERPGPHLWFDEIHVGGGEVDLDFGFWRMDVAVGSGLAALEIAEDLLDIRGENLDGASFTLTGGLLPENLRFLGNQASEFFVSSFHMDRHMLNARQTRIIHPDFEAGVDFLLYYEEEQLPVESLADVVLLNPERLAEITAGSVRGTAGGQVAMTGSLQAPRIEGHLKASDVDVQMLHFDGVEANAVVQVGDTVVVSIPFAEATIWEGHVEVAHARVAVAKDRPITVEYDVCVDGFRPALLLHNFGVSGLPVGHDARVNACVEDGTLTLTEELPLEGNLHAYVHAGSWLSSFGVTDASLDTQVRFDLGGLGWDWLSLDTNLGAFSALGEFQWKDGSVLDTRLEAWNLVLDEITPVAQQQIGGLVESLSASFVGPLLNPALELHLFASGVQVQGNRMEWIETTLELDDGQLEVPSLCLRSGPNVGCLSLDAQFERAGLNSLGFPATVDLVIDQPLRLQLESLPFVELPVVGEVAVESARLNATVTEDWRQTLASLSGTSALSVKKLSGDSWRVGELTAQVEKSTTTPDSAIGGIALRAESETLGFPGTEIRQLKVSGTLNQFDGWPDEEPLPRVDGDVALEASGLNLEGNTIRRFLLEAQSRPSEHQMSGAGRIVLNHGLTLEVAGEIDTEERTLAARMDFRDFPLSSVPGIPVGTLPSWLEPVQASGYVRIDRGNLDALLAGKMVRLVRTLVGRGSLRLRNLEGLPEPASHLNADVAMRGGRIAVSPATLEWKNGSILTVEGWLDPWQKKLDVSLTQSRSRLNAWTLVRELDLPVSLSVGLSATVEGSLDAPNLDSSIAVRSLEASGIQVGDADVRVSGQYGDRLYLSSRSFFPGLQLKRSSLAFENGAPAYLNADLEFNEFSAAQVVPDLPEGLEASASGSVAAHIDFREGREPFLITALIPKGQLKGCSKKRTLKLCAENKDDTGVMVNSREVVLKNLAITSEGHFLDLSGSLSFRRGWDIRVGFGIDIYRLKFLSEAFASYSGLLLTGEEKLQLTGALDSPEIKGTVLFKDVVVLPRNFGSELVISNAAIDLRGNLARGNVLAIMPEDAPIRGGMDEGSFQGHGWFRLVGWQPDGGMLFLSGRDIYYQQPGEFKILVSPNLEIELKHLTDSEKAESRISGTLQVTEGEYTRDFDRLLGSFATAFSRSQERYSKPITEIFPLIKDTKLDLTIRGGNFNVSSRFPFGETELTVDLDLRVGGTPESLLLYDRMRVIPGGVITYKVVKRVFEVEQGNVDFSGNPAHPYLDVKAQTEVLYKPPEDYATTWSLEEREWGKPVLIEIHITGEYPNITFDLSSDSPEFDVADLQTLLLLGMTRRDLEGRNESGRSDVSINILTEDVAGLVSELILAPFVDAVSLGFTQEGGIRAETETHIGRAMNLNTQVRQDSTRSEYSAGFQFKITDRLYLEGKMKMIQEDSESLRNYEGKFRYLIPLD